MEQRQAEPLDWYEKTETSTHILNEAVTCIFRIIHQEKKLQNPDQELIDNLAAQSKFVKSILRQPKNFLSLKSMDLIINQYTPMVTYLKKVERDQHLELI